MADAVLLGCHGGALKRIVGGGRVGVAQDEAAVTPEDAVFVANNVWMMVATFLVFIMHLGFATLESGLQQAKNTVNILFKNTAIVAIGLLTYAIVGFNLMYPPEFSIGQFFGFGGFGSGSPLAPGRMSTWPITRVGSSSWFAFRMSSALTLYFFASEARLSLDQTLTTSPLTGGIVSF